MSNDFAALDRVLNRESLLEDVRASLVDAYTALGFAKIRIQSTLMDPTIVKWEIPILTDVEQAKERLQAASLGVRVAVAKNNAKL